jgi:hypothetical protein
MESFKTILVSCARSLSALLNSGVNDQTYKESEYWSCVKWTFTILKRYCFRYGNPDYGAKKNKKFAKHWMETYSCSFWEILNEYLKSLKLIKMPKKQGSNLIACLFHCFQMDSIVKKFESTYEELMLDILFEIIKFTKEDQELFEDNPVEYFRKVISRLT